MELMRQRLFALPPVPTVIISVALMLFSGFLLTRVTKLLRLPNVTAYIVAGILIGPYCLNLVPPRIIEGTDFLSDIALAFIAFSTGEFFKLSVLRRNGMKVVLITVAEAVLVDGTLEQITEAVHAVLDEMGTRNFILGADCTLPTDIALARIAGAVEATGTYRA